VTVAISVAYLTTSLLGFYWAVYLSMTGLYGIPFSNWYAVMFLGSALLLVGTLLRWTSFVFWARWLCLAGCTALASYFVPATVLLIQEGRIDLLRAAIAVLVTTCVIVSVIEVRELTEQQRRAPHS
jgi:hypothetical protein